MCVWMWVCTSECVCVCVRCNHWIFHIVTIGMLVAGIKLYAFECLAILLLDLFDSLAHLHIRMKWIQWFFDRVQLWWFGFFFISMYFLVCFTYLIGFLLNLAMFAYAFLPIDKHYYSNKINSLTNFSHCIQHAHSFIA